MTVEDICAEFMDKMQELNIPIFMTLIEDKHTHNYSNKVDSNLICEVHHALFLAHLHREQAYQRQLRESN